MNRPTEAKKCLLEVLELDPNNEEALVDLHDIEKKGGLAERVKMAEAQKKTEKNSSIPTAEKSPLYPHKNLKVTSVRIVENH